MTAVEKFFGHLSGPAHGMRSLLLLLVCVAAFLPGIAALPPIDRDESRFVQATKQMAETGDHIDIRFQDVPRYKKPIGIYWLQSAALMLTSANPQTDIWAYRLVSVAGAAIAVLGAAWLGTLLFGGAAGLISGLLMAAAFMLCFEARIAKTDAVLLAACVLAQACLARAYLAKSGETPGAAWIGFWLALGAGILIKGPITPVLAALTVAALCALDRSVAWVRNLRPIAGLGIALAVTAPWLIAITYKSGGAFWAEAVGKDLLGKAAGAQESHGAPPGYFTLIFSVFIWPLPVLAVKGGLAAISRFWGDARLRFLFAWYVPWWLLVEFMPTKLPHYILPAYPALVLLAAWHLTAKMPAQPQPQWHIWLVLLTRCGLFAATLAIVVMAIGLPLYTDGAPSAAGVLAAIAAALAGWIGADVGKAGAMPAASKAAALAVGSMAVWALMAGSVLPSAQFLWPSRQIAAAFDNETKSCANPQLFSAGFQEPSLVFLSGTNTVLTDGKAAAQGLASKPDCSMAAVADSEAPAFKLAINKSAGLLIHAGSVEAFNYSKGRNVRLELYMLKK